MNNATSDNSEAKMRDPLSPEELTDFKTLLEFFYLQPENGAIYELQTDKKCYDTLATKVNNGNNSNIVKGRFIRDLYFGYGYNTKDNQRKNRTKTITPLLDFLKNYKSQTELATSKPLSDNSGPCSEEKILAKVDTLKTLYDNNEIELGIEQANNAYKECGAHYKILRYFFRFNMRLGNWAVITTEAAKILQSNPKEKEDIFTLCKLATVECKLRDAYSNNHPNNKERLKQQIDFAQTDLHSVPETQRSQYPDWAYWQGRWYLEWWYYNSGVNENDLKFALSYFEKSLNIKSTWYVLFYKCVVLKLLKGKSSEPFKETRKEYTTKITEEIIMRPKMASVRTYRISSLLLNEINTQEFSSFLKDNSNSDSPITDFSSTMKHHLKLIFFRETNNYNKYKKILDTLN